MPTEFQDPQTEQPESLPTMLPNYFADSEVAARYVKARPFFHAEVAERICNFTGVSRFRRTLDVGCGSGQSSLALAAIADTVIAIDASETMLNHAPLDARIHYQLGVAEQLDFRPEEFDLITVGSALHWFNLERFFAQCRNVISPAGVLAVYNDHFTAHMQETAACKRWMRTTFARRFPAPKRGMRDMDESTAAAHGFEVALRSSFSHLVPFSRGEFIEYLLTRSNTLAAIRSGKEEQRSVIEWLDREVAAFLPDGMTGTFVFKCNLWLMRLTSTEWPARG